MGLAFRFAAWMAWGSLWLGLAGPAHAQQAASPDADVQPLYTTTTPGTLATAGATAYNLTSRPEFGGA